MSLTPGKPLKEAERLALLNEYQVLDTPPEQAYDDIVTLAANIFGTPIAMVSLVDADRQWFKARKGLEFSSTPRDVAFCAHAILDTQPFVIPDAEVDPRFAENPLVTKTPHVRFYAGAPLMASGGHNLGTLCVMDNMVRNVTPEQVGLLEALARLVVGQLEMRRISGLLASALERSRTLSGLLPICSYCRRIRDDKEYWSDVEAYVGSHAPVEFSHGICPQCVEEHFSDEKVQKELDLIDGDVTPREAKKPRAS